MSSTSNFTLQLASLYLNPNPMHMHHGVAAIRLFTTDQCSSRENDDHNQNMDCCGRIYHGHRVLALTDIWCNFVGGWMNDPCHATTRDYNCITSWEQVHHVDFMQWVDGSGALYPIVFPIKLPPLFPYNWFSTITHPTLPPAADGFWLGKIELGIADKRMVVAPPSRNGL